MIAPSALRAKALEVLRGHSHVAAPGPVALPPEPYLSLRGVSGSTGISTTSLWRYNIPGHDLGGRRRYLLSEVHAYLKSEAFQRHAAALRAERRNRSSSKEIPPSRRRALLPEKGGGR